MNAQVTFRLPAGLARALARRARERGLPRSLLVREALETYLAESGGPAAPLSVRERIAPFVGAVQLDRAAAERDAIAQRIRRHNWRD